VPTICLEEFNIENLIQYLKSILKLVKVRGGKVPSLAKKALDNLTRTSNVLSIERRVIDFL
jgi:hypothetical protein